MYSHRELLETFKCYQYDISKKIRIGRLRDGGYVLPNLPYTKLYSFVISTDMSFDVDFINKYKDSTVEFYDPTISNLPYSDIYYDENRIQFYSVGLGSTNDIKIINGTNCTVKTLDDIVSKEINNDMLLKIKINGDEYESLSSASETTLNKFMSIVIEYNCLSSDDNIKNKIDCVEKINKLFYPVHIHANNHTQPIIKDEIYHVPDVLEVTYIRKDLYDGQPSFTKDKFPTVLDYPNHGFNEEIKFNFYPFRPYYFSLSVIPSRIPNLNSVIEKLQNQHIKPEKIFVNISKYYERFDCQGFIPTNIKDMSNVVINICEKDYGPATKFLPIMNIDEVDDDDPVIIIDDDGLYDPKLSSYLLKDSVRYPDSCITVFGITNSAYLFNNYIWIRDSNSQNLEPCGYRENNEGYIDCFEAFRGTLLKKKFFKDDVFIFPNQEYKFSDDVWFSGHILKNNFTIFISCFKNEQHIMEDDNGLSYDMSIALRRMTDTAIYFQNTYGIWKN
jgi:hypothetical protein